MKIAPYIKKKKNEKSELQEKDWFAHTPKNVLLKITGEFFRCSAKSTRAEQYT